VNGWPLSVVRDEDGAEEPTVADEVLAERLGFSSVDKLRELHTRNADEIGEALVSTHGGGKPLGGRPKRTRLYTEEQATLLTMFARTAVGWQRWGSRNSTRRPALDADVAA
jgi:hypothetical protein